AKSLPAKTLEVLPDGSELVVMRESDGMLARRRRESRNHAAPRLPDTIARLVTFMIMTETASGKRKATRVRVLTTLLDQASVMIDDIARLPRHRPGRQRTSGRTTTERRNGRTENVTYTITIEESNLPEWDSSPNT
ncbi:MAG TPA: hypothetical protein VHZ03_23250, partial [Trebonia sp.]|nr:hypothetical protein [Trebonia sp.]